MKKYIVIFIPLLLLYAPTRIFYSDWDWGYYYWLFGPIGPNHSQGMAAAGFSTLEYRGYNQFTINGYPGAGTEISSLVLRLRNNTGGAGLQIDINRVFSNTPGWDECGGTEPIYLTNQAVNASAEDYTYFDLTGTQAKDDFINAWQSSSWFGLGYKGSRGTAEPCMHFFYAFWADEMLDAALIIDYVIVGLNEHEEKATGTPLLSVYPNPCRKITNIRFSTGYPDRITSLSYGTSWAEGMELKIYNASGRLVRQFKDLTNYPFNQVVWDGTDQAGQRVVSGVYFVKLQTAGNSYIEKIIFVH